MSHTPPGANEPTCFPYVHSGEPGLPAWQRVRAEGLPLRQAISSGLAYLRKYRRAKYSAPPEEVRYFDHQRQLLRRLMTTGPATGPRLGMVGDIMWLRDSWQTFLAPEVLGYLNGHEFVLGNLETVISSRFRVPSFWPDYFTYNSHPALVTSFARPDGRSTFSALATCNNHCTDRGDDGLRDTLDFLDGLRIAHAGVRRRADEAPFVVVETGGVSLGFYAACWGLNNPAQISRSALHIEVLPGLVPRVIHPVDLSRIRRALEGMDAAGADFKVVSLHWGYEFEFYPDPDVVRIGREIIRAGADVVMGTHPHVIQPLEVCFVNGYERRYGDDLAALRPETGCVIEDGRGTPRKGLIAYSLGNFATAMFTLHCRTGLVLSVRLGRDEQTGRLDWHRPEMQLVFNVPRDPATRQRRLVLLDNWLGQQEQRGDRAQGLRDLAGFLHRHLAG